MIIAQADASLSSEFLGVGWILTRKERGSREIIDIGHLTFDRAVLKHEYHTHLAEYKAVIHAVRAATEFDDESIVVYSDNEGVVSHINEGYEQVDDGYFKHALFSFLNRFDWHVEWLPKRKNNVAHKQARFGAKVA
jgi:ribonuclease HI